MPKMANSPNFVEGSTADPLRLGARLRASRRRSGLTIAGAAKASGLSTGFISLLENGKTDATVGRMSQLLGIYGMTVSDAFGSDQDHATAPHRAEVLSQASEYVSLQEKLTYRFFDPDGSDVLPVHVLIEPGGGWLDVSLHQGEENIFVLHGSVELQVFGDTVVLNRGDRFQVQALAPHTYRAIGAETVELFVLLRDPKVLEQKGKSSRYQPERT